MCQNKRRCIVQSWPIRLSVVRRGLNFFDASSQRAFWQFQPARRDDAFFLLHSREMRWVCVCSLWSLVNFVIWLRCERAHEPRDNHLFEDDGIGPYLHLSPQVTALRIDPGCLGNVSLAEQQIDI